MSKKPTKKKNNRNRNRNRNRANGNAPKAAQQEKELKQEELDEEQEVSATLESEKDVAGKKADVKAEEKHEDPDDEPSDARQGPPPQPPKKRERKKTSVEAYASEVVSETKRVTWPGRDEVLKWSLIVLAAIAFFTLFTFLIDNFVANPIVYAISGIAGDDVGFGKKAIALTVAFFVSGLGTMIGVMLHSGGDENGLSEGLSATLTGGSGVAEKNLDRITVVLALLFAATIICMMIWFPIGTIAA